jgi:hypothetical protein
LQTKKSRLRHADGSFLNLGKMPLTIPERISDFFTKYEDALNIFMFEDGRAYLNHYQDKATKVAMQEGLPLFSVNAALESAQVYPVIVLKTYIGTAALGSFTKCHCNKSNFTAEDPNDIEYIQYAMESAVQAAGVALESIATVVEGDNVKMTITTYTAAAFKFGDTAFVLQ